MRAPLLALALLIPAAPLAAAGPLSCDLWVTGGSGALDCGLPVVPGWNLCPPGAQCRFVPLLACHVEVPGEASCEQRVLP